MAFSDQFLLAHAKLIWREQKEDNGRNQCTTISSPILILSKSLWELRLSIKDDFVNDFDVPRKRKAEQRIGVS
ncbi:hypothetical protein Gotur_026468 [Gossypium turneri]